jgi:hypothetical protein
MSASGTSHTSSSLSGGLIQTALTSSQLASRSLLVLVSALENCKLPPALPSQPIKLLMRLTCRSFAYGQMALQLAKMVYAYDMELVDQDLDWINTCKMHFLWWKPELNVRFSPGTA